MGTDLPGGKYDAVVVGAGPNGLAAAITLARRGLAVLLLEATDKVGGGVRSAELTLPGFLHDVCSAVHPLAVASPFFQSIPLAEHGLEFIHPPAPLAHPLEDGRVAMLERSLDETAAALGDDGRAYADLVGPLVAKGYALLDELLRPPRLPRSPLLMARFGLRGLRSAAGVVERLFRTEAARALFAGNAAHSILPLEFAMTSAVGLVLTMSGHLAGWPIARGGSGAIAAALEGCFRSLGGKVVTGHRVESWANLPPARAYLFDVAPPQVARIAGAELPPGFVRKLERHRYGPAVFKVDWALSSPIPWRNPECLRAGTVHVGGTAAEIAHSERAAWGEKPGDRPFVLVAQQSLFDPSRAPVGKHTGWGYCHVPRGCDVEMTSRIEAQIERFAPGFRDTILARHTMSPAAMERHNANNVGGDIAGGVHDLRALLGAVLIPRSPYATPNRKIYLCSASSPPGPGVHGMCGYHAAQVALSRCF